VFISQALSTEMCGTSKVLARAPQAVVHDGIPLPSIPTSADRNAARNRLGFNSDKVLVLFAGQIVQHKGVADLINAWQLLSDTCRRQVEILVIGEDLQKQGEYRRAMESLAKEIGCPARFLGFQRNMAEWQMAADIAVVPSHVEPLGLVVMEAMAHGLPVVGSDVGGIPEMIVHGETGLLVSPRDPKSLASALERLINCPQERRRLGEAGRRRCEMHFSIEAHVEKMIEQYRLAMAAVKRPAFA
jgi:glycosyltransferase involved in cell wall biosynthesis